MIMNIVRIAKVVALLAFVLPWVAVSCNGTDLATASGIELIQGTMTENPQAGSQFSASFGIPSDGTMTQSSSTQIPEMEMNYFALGAAILIAVGLGLSFIGRAAPIATLLTSVVAAGLVYGAVWQFKQEAVKSNAATQQGGGAPASPFGGSDNPFGAQMGAMNQMGANMVDQMIQERIGFWVALGGLIVAAGASGIALGSRGGGRSSVRPDSM